MGTTQYSCCKNDAVNERSRRKTTSHNKIQALKLKRRAPQNYWRRSSKRRPSSIKSRAWADSIKHDPASNTSKRKHHEICSDDEHDPAGKLIHAALTTSTSSSQHSPMLPDQPCPALQSRRRTQPSSILPLSHTFLTQTKPELHFVFLSHRPQMLYP